MPKNMGFIHTVAQVVNRTQTVTRRRGWWSLKPGDILFAVVQVTGLEKGARFNRICRIRIVSTRREPLDAITDEDVAREGCPDMDREVFIRRYRRIYKGPRNQEVNRIEFEYPDGG